MPTAAEKSSSLSEVKAPANKDIKDLVAAELPSLIDIRHDLHTHPELFYQEKRTSGVIQRELAKLESSGMKFKAGLAKGTGVLAYLPPTDKAGEGKPSIGLRADMDALPITEKTGKPYASKTEGIMHACGHDGHVTILLGAARVLSKLPHRPRGVHFVFQPAEESGAGGDAMCREGVLDGKVLGPKIERMYGLHGWPTFPLNQVGSRPGPLLASTDEITVTIEGEQSHAAYPHFSRDSVLCAAQCILSLQQIVSRNASPFDNVVCSVTIVQAGTATNIIPRHAKFEGTVRTITPEARAFAKKRIFEIVNGIAAAHDCKAKVEWHEGYPVTFNDPSLTERWFETADKTFGKDRVMRVADPTMGGEDFSYYAQKVPSVFFMLGLQNPGDQNPATLHQPEFDFNDKAIATGVEMFVALATE